MLPVSILDSSIVNWCATPLAARRRSRRSALARPVTVRMSVRSIAFDRRAQASSIDAIARAAVKAALGEQGLQLLELVAAAQDFGVRKGGQTPAKAPLATAVLAMVSDL